MSINKTESWIHSGLEIVFAGGGAGGGGEGNKIGCSRNTRLGLGWETKKRRVTSRASR